MKDYPELTNDTPEEIQKRIDEETEKCKHLKDWPNPDELPANREIYVRPEHKLKHGAERDDKR